MKVQVLSHYDTIEMVNVVDLRQLIAAGEVLALRRSSGWVKVGTDGCEETAVKSMMVLSAATSSRKPFQKSKCRAGIIA